MNSYFKVNRLPKAKGNTRIPLKAHLNNLKVLDQCIINVDQAEALNSSSERSRTVDSSDNNYPADSKCKLGLSCTCAPTKRL